LLDDHDNACLGHFLKIWTDKYACTAESKGATIPLMHRDFVITSNYTIDQMYAKDGDDQLAAIKRRFKVIHMDKPFARAKPNECELLPEQ